MERLEDQEVLARLAGWEADDRVWSLPEVQVATGLDKTGISRLWRLCRLYYSGTLPLAAWPPTVGDRQIALPTRLEVVVTWWPPHEAVLPFPDQWGPGSRPSWFASTIWMWMLKVGRMDLDGALVDQSHRKSRPVFLPGSRRVPVDVDPAVLAAVEDRELVDAGEVAVMVGLSAEELDELVQMTVFYALGCPEWPPPWRKQVRLPENPPEQGWDVEQDAWYTDPRVLPPPVRIDVDPAMDADARYVPRWRRGRIVLWALRVDRLTLKHISS